jgi:tetratricopeptide (TPR) repeat protein
MLAHALRDKGDAAEARKQVQKAIDLSTNNGYLRQAADAYIELGNSYANYGEELNNKIGYYQQALKVFVQAGNTLRQADIGKDLGDLCLPANYDPSHSRSLGMTLIHGFTRQLGGKLTISSTTGMCINLIFQEENLHPTYSKASYAY